MWDSFLHLKPSRKKSKYEQTNLLKMNKRAVLQGYWYKSLNLDLVLEPIGLTKIKVSLANPNEFLLHTT